MSWVCLSEICRLSRRLKLIGEDKERTADGSSTSLLTWLLIGLVTTVIVVLVAVYPSLRSPSETPAGTKQFRSVADDFTVRYPEGWEKLAAAELNDEYQETFDFAVKRSDPDALLGVRIERLSAGEAKLEEVAELLEKTLAQRFKRFEKITAATVEIASGEEALKYEYRFLARDSMLVRQQVLIVPAGEKVYYVTTWTGENDHAEIASDLEEMIDTFRLN